MLRGRAPGIESCGTKIAAVGRRLRYFVDLHCHTIAIASDLALSSPRKVVEAAATRGLTHLAVTDHDRIEGALAGSGCGAGRG